MFDNQLSQIALSEMGVAKKMHRNRGVIGTKNFFVT